MPTYFHDERTCDHWSCKRRVKGQPASLDVAMSTRVMEHDVEDGGVTGDLVVCPTCTGDGVLHRPHEMPEPSTPQEAR